MLEDNKFYTCKYDIPFKEIFLKEQNKDYIKPRNMAFLCDMYAGHTLVGESYTEETKIIQINFSYGLKDNNGIRIYKIQDKENKEFVNNFLIYEINMDYYLKLWYNKNEQQVNIYKYLIMLNLEENDLKEISIKDKVVMKFMDELVKLNSRPEFREYMSVEEDERKIHNSLLQSSYNEGKKEEKLNFTKKLLLTGLDIKTISNLTDLSEEEIKKLNSRPEFREYMSVEEDERKIHNSLLQSSYNEGINEGIIKTAINLLNENIDINIIAKVTGLSLDKIKELNKN